MIDTNTIYKYSIIKILCENTPNLMRLNINYINYIGSIPECIGYQFINLKYILFSSLNNLISTIP